MLPARELKMMILHLTKNFPAIIALFLSPCGHWSWWLEERLSVPPLSGRERRPLQMDFTDHQCTGDRTFCSTSSLFAYNVGITPPLHIGIGLLQHHLGFLPYATLYVLNTLGWLKHFFWLHANMTRQMRNC